MPNDIEKRVGDIEKRLTRLEQNTSVFHLTVSRKLADTMTLLQKHQQSRDAKMAEALKKLAQALTDIRERLGPFMGPPPRITH